MEKRSDLKESLTPQEALELRKIIKENSWSPAKIGYIFYEEQPLHPGLLLWLLIEERFDDVGVFLVFRFAMTEDSTRTFLEHHARWNTGRIDRAITRAKLYYFYYSKFAQ